MNLPIPSRARPHAGRRRASGFTFTEILVVIAIILVLLAMVLAIGAALFRSAKRRACLATFEHVKNAQAVLRNRVGWAVDEQEAAGWTVSSDGGATWRPLTPMEYFLLICRNAPEAQTHIDLIGKDQVVASSPQASGVYTALRIRDAGSAGPDGIWATGDDVAPAIRYTLLASNDPTANDGNRAPLRTVVSPWGSGARWSASTWWNVQVTAATGAIAAPQSSGFVLPSMGGPTVAFNWRPHEFDFRKFTDDGDPTTPSATAPSEWQIRPPYIPPCESTVVSAPGPDGVWGLLVNFDPSRRDADAKDNLYSNQRDE